jgi:1-acyl-sn-glycerol-3-phosphate acyltransferase
MDVLTILIVIVIVGVLLWLVNSYIPMDGKIKKILNIVVVILLVIWLLSAFGAFHYLGGVHLNTR